MTVISSEHSVDTERADVIPSDRFDYKPGGGSTLIIACGAIAREIVDLIEHNRWTHLDVTCLPAIWHNHPQRIPEGVREKIRAARGRYERILVGYGDCGTGGLLDKVLAEEGGVERLPGPHCYSFFSGTREFARQSETEITAFYLTDYLARHFETLIWRGFGMERHPELRDMYFANYEKVVYLAQTQDPSLDALAEAAARKLGLGYERRQVGYGDLRSKLAETSTPGR